MALDPYDGRNGMVGNKHGLPSAPAGKWKARFEEVKALLELVVMGSNRQSPVGPDPMCLL